MFAISTTIGINTGRKLATKFQKNPKDEETLRSISFFLVKRNYLSWALTGVILIVFLALVATISKPVSLIVRDVALAVAAMH